MKQFIKKTSIVAFGLGLSQIINFIFSLILVRVLTVHEYAIYKQGMLLVTTIQAVFFIVNPLSLSYFLAKCEILADKKAYLLQTIIGIAFCSIAGAAVMIVFKDYLSSAYNNSALTKYMPLFALFMVFELTSSFYTYYMVAENRNTKLAIVTILFSGIRLLSLLACVVFEENKLYSFLVVNALTVALKLFYMVWDSLRVYVNIKIKFEIIKIKEQIKFSIPIYLFGIIAMLNTNLDKNIVSVLYQPDIFAIYVNGTTEIPIISIITSSIITVMLPEISSQLKTNDQIILDTIILKYMKVIEYSFLVFVPLISSLFVFSQGIVTILYSDKYIMAVPIFSLFIFMIMFRALNIGVLITAANKQLEMVKAGIFATILNCLMLYLIKVTLGFNYLPIASLFSTLFMNIFLLYVVKKTYRQKKLTNLLPYRKILVFSLSCLIVGCIFSLINSIWSSQIILKTIVLFPLCYIIGLCSCLRKAQFSSILKIMYRWNHKES